MPVSKPQDIASYFEFSNLDYLEAVKKAGKGAICMSAHYGNWEWMGAALIAKGFPVTFMIGTQSNPYVDKLFNEYRSKVGIRFVRIKAVKEVIRGLKNGEFMAFLGDQDGDRWGCFVDFFGHPASTYTFGDIMARKTGAAMFFGVPRRLGARQHHVDIVPLPEAPAALSETEALAFRLQAYNSALEKAVREDPGQWLWMQHRWRAQPVHRLEGEERLRVERGEARFDMARQAWVAVPGGEVLELKTWKP
jgi:KDO2-lipid IV(A) lauroyltransferase